MKIVLTILVFLATRLKEPSTWASIAVALASANVSVPTGLWAKITFYGTIAAVALGVLLKEANVKGS